MPLDAYVQNQLPKMTNDGLAALVPASLSVYQHTLAAPVSYSGVGVHSGVVVNMRLLPAAPGTGITFIRTDVPAAHATIMGRWDAVADTRLCTVLANEHGVKVATVEHVLSGLHGLGVDNVAIEVDGQELPVADGSALEFIKAIMEVGVVPQTAPRRALQILQAVEVANGPKVARLLPCAQPEYAVTIVYENQVIGTQGFDLALTPATYLAEIAPARTFGLLADVEAMYAAGLGKGGSLDNAIVVDADRVLNPEGLRYADEFARHKVLDAVGDLALAGGVVLGRLEGHMSGHKMNNDLLRAVFANPANYRWVEMTDDAEMPAIMTGNPMGVKATSAQAAA